jgi:hypothetical protein
VPADFAYRDPAALPHIEVLLIEYHEQASLEEKQEHNRRAGVHRFRIQESCCAQNMISRKRIGRIYIAILAYMLAPIAISLIAVGFAWATGSNLHEGSSSQCVILGHDVGGFLYPCSNWFGLKWSRFPRVPL